VRVPNRLLSLIAVAGALGSLAGCQLAADLSQVGSLTIQVSAVPDTFALGDSTVLTVRAHNPTRDTVRFQTGGCDPLGIEIRSANGDLVLPATVGCEQGSNGVLVPPGSSIQSTLVWRGERWIGPGSTPPAPLAPGVYRVRGFLNADGRVAYGEPTPVWLTAP
jgi:hypothetical protein